MKLNRLLQQQIQTSAILIKVNLIGIYNRKEVQIIMPALPPHPPPPLYGEMKLSKTIDGNDSLNVDIASRPLPFTWTSCLEGRNHNCLHCTCRCNCILCYTLMGLSVHTLQLLQNSPWVKKKSYVHKLLLCPTYMCLGLNICLPQLEHVWTRLGIHNLEYDSYENKMSFQ